MSQLNTDTPSRLDVDSATQVFEGFLSENEPEYREPEQKSKKAPQGESTPPQQDEEEDEESVEGAEATDDAGDEEQASDDEGESDETDEQTDDETPEPRKFKVKANGQDIEVTEDELVKGYSRTADYTQKTQALAAERKAFQSEKEAVSRERQEYATYLGQLKTALEQSAQEPDWDKLRAEDPDAFQIAWTDWQRHKERLAKVEKEQQETMAKVARDHAERFNAYVAEQKSKLLEALPAWADEAVAKKEAAEMREFAQSLGYTDDEINQVYDHRLILVLRDAAAFRKSQQQAETVRKKVEKVVVEKPGQKKPRKKMPEAVKAQLLARKTGRVEHAAKYFEQIID